MEKFSVFCVLRVHINQTLDRENASCVLFKHFDPIRVTRRVYFGLQEAFLYSEFVKIVSPAWNVIL